MATDFIRERVLALHAQGRLSKEQVAKAVNKGWLPSADADPVVLDQVRLASINRVQIEAKAKAALAVNNTYLAITSPTNAQNAAQVKALTREVNALIKLVINDLDNTTGT